MEKFAGLGIKQVIALWIILSLITIMVKTILVKYPVKGLTETVLNI